MFFGARSKYANFELDVPEALNGLRGRHVGDDVEFEVCRGSQILCLCADTSALFWVCEDRLVFDPKRLASI